MGEQIDQIVLAGDQETIILLLRSQMSKELEDKVTRRSLKESEEWERS